MGSREVALEIFMQQLVLRLIHFRLSSIIPRPFRCRAILFAALQKADRFQFNRY